MGRSNGGRMSAVTANLVGITGIARRLVMDGALEEQPAREAMAAATAEKNPPKPQSKDTHENVQRKTR